MEYIYIFNKNKIYDFNNIDNITFSFKENRSDILAYKLLAKLLVNKYNISNTNIVFDKYNKGFLFDNAIYFNISYADDLIVIYISKSICGVDIENVNRKLNQSFIKNINDENPILKWTKIEAYFKYVGTGIIKSKIRNIDVSNVNTIKVDINSNSYYISYVSKDSKKAEVIYDL